MPQGLLELVLVSGQLVLAREHLQEVSEVKESVKADPVDAFKKNES